MCTFLTCYLEMIIYQRVRKGGGIRGHVCITKTSSHDGLIGAPTGGPGGGCARMPVGIPSPPRGGCWKPHSRAMLGTVGAKRADSAIRGISNCRESHVQKAFE
jgi:hypothetical protein